MSDFRVRRMIRRNEDLQRKQERQKEKRRRLYEEDEASRRNKSNNNEHVGLSSPRHGAITSKTSSSTATSPPSSKWISTKRKDGYSSSQSPSKQESPIKSILRGEGHHHQSRTSISSTKDNKRTKSSFGDGTTHRPVINDKWLDDKPGSKHKPTRDSTPQKESPIKCLRDQQKSSLGTATSTIGSGSKRTSRLSIDDKWLDPPRQQRRNQMEGGWPDSENLRRDAGTNAKVAAAASKPNNDDDDSDSDSDASFDLLAAFLRDRGIAKTPVASSSSPENDPPVKQNLYPGQKRELYPGEKKELYPGQKKELYHCEKRDDSQNSGVSLGSRRLSGLDNRRSSSSSPHDSENSYNEVIHSSRIDSSSMKIKIIPRRKSKDESDDDDNDNDDDNSNNGNDNNSIPHNPIALKKAEDEKYRLLAEQNMSRPTVDDDDLWDDSVFEENEKGKSAENIKKRGRLPSANKKKTGTATTSKKKTRRSKSPNDDANTSFDSYDHDILDDDDEQQNVLGKDENELKRELHPEFAYPPFGPYDLEPLVLNSAEDEKGEAATSHQVPAALSRYIAPFQRVGIEFMYRCLSAGRGSIMGDEMGLGKTLQVLALLTALFNKSGTAMDLRDIQKRKQTVRKRLDIIEKEKQSALLEGRTISNDPDWKTELSVPDWYPVLIIVPATLIENWKKEFDRFTHFSVAEYRGTKRSKALNSVRNGTAEILLTAHSTFRGKDDFQELNSVAWKLVVIDEFHMFKNPKKKLSVCLRELKATNPTQIIGMTGTLMQNNHEELWNLVDLIETNFLGSWQDFKLQFSGPIKIGRTKGADPSAVQRSLQKADALSRKLDQIMIDRKKEEVLKDQLPEKAEQVVFCEPSALQKRVYRHILQLPDFELVKTHAAPCDCSANRSFFRKYFKLKSNAERVQYYRQHKGEIIKRSKCCYTLPWNPNRYEEGQPLIDPDAALWRTQKNHGDEEGCDYCPTCIMLPAFVKLNKVASHLALLLPKKTPNCEVVGSNDWTSFMKEQEFAKVALPQDVIEKLPGASLIRKDGIMDNHFELSGKLEVLDKLLRRFEKEENNKTLIFSYSTQTLDLIQHYVRSKGFSHDRMDGDTSFVKRQEIADRFNSDGDLFLLLLSTKAMGLGLNLTSATKVVIFDVEWNPSWDQQAQDRAYRIGQKNNVDVFRLVSQGTLDELRYLRQLYKVQLKQATMTENDSSAPKAAPPKIFRGVQGDTERKGELFGAENLFKFKDGCFLDEVWKRVRPEKAGKRTGGLNIHDTIALAEQLGEMGEEKCENILSLENEELDTIPLNEENLRQSDSPQTTEHPEKESKDKSTAEEEDVLAESANKSTQLGAQALNHEDLFREDRGGAAVEMGDDDYDIELGGGSQNALLIVNEKGLLFAGDPSDNEDGNDESNNVQADDPKESSTRMSSIKEEKEYPPPNQKRSAARPKNKSDTVVIDCDSDDRQPSPQARAPLPGTKKKDNENAQGEKPAQNQKSTMNAMGKPLATKKNENAKRPVQQQGPTVNLMGKPSTKKVETAFSMADLPIPDYKSKKNNGKKKKRKRKAADP